MDRLFFRSLPMFGWLKALFGLSPASNEQNSRLSAAELANRLGVSWDHLKAVVFGPHRLYRWHRIPKKRGGKRTLHTPIPELKEIQRRLLRKLFAKLPVHPCAMGFVKGKSIVDHARVHQGRKLILKVDIKDFFSSTRYVRIQKFLRQLGWQTTYRSWVPCAFSVLMGAVYYKGLPQGAPTSPILSNLINYKMDCRLAALARASRARYSRYADDIVFSFDEDDVQFVRGVLRRIRKILYENGYRINIQKTRILRQHQCQQITGLVVNQKVQLPRKTRRLLRAVEHRMRNFKPTTMTRQELNGWRAFELMVKRKSRGGNR
jgi:retron-type reverse transcriptase